MDGSPGPLRGARGGKRGLAARPLVEVVGSSTRDLQRVQQICDATPGRRGASPARPGSREDPRKQLNQRAQPGVLMRKRSFQNGETGFARSGYTSDVHNTAKRGVQIAT